MSMGADAGYCFSGIALGIRDKDALTYFLIALSFQLGAGKLAPRDNDATTKRALPTVSIGKCVR